MASDIHQCSGFTCTCIDQPAHQYSYLYLRSIVGQPYSCERGEHNDEFSYGSISENQSTRNRLDQADGVHVPHLRHRLESNLHHNRCRSLHTPVDSIVYHLTVVLCEASVLTIVFNLFKINRDLRQYLWDKIRFCRAP